MVGGYESSASDVHPGILFRDTRAPPLAPITTGELGPREQAQLREHGHSLGFLQNRLQRLSLSSRRHSSSPDRSDRTKKEGKGPLGLCLLHEPAEPRIDFVFVHGLCGGSKKTWSYTSEPGMFWPKDWLPNEVGFKHVRLHSYGYNSDWKTRKESPLTIHDFGQALLADLHNSPALRKNGEQINDEFRHVCGNLSLWSFSEAIPTSYGLTSSLVVDKESAILGLPKEHVQYLEATHRDICKFDNPVNSNYLVLQRAFLTTIDEIGTERVSAVFHPTGERVTNTVSLVSSRGHEEYRADMKKITSLLRVQRPDAILLATNEKQHAGSCQWLTNSHPFQEWVDIPFDWEDANPLLAQYPAHPTSKILWLNGRPGTGKSVATGHVVRYLQSCNFDCSYYFFEHGDKVDSTVAAFLRSIALQMAEASFDVRRALVSMADDGITLKQDDHHTLFTTLFVDRIFRLEQCRPHFWVIDALDECSTKGIPALVSMLSNLDSRFPIRVFITSRPGGQIGRLLNLERAQVSELTTGQEGSLKDIELFLKARCPWEGDPQPYLDLVSDVLSKSNGIFLWAALTSAKLEDAYSVEDKQDILRQIPPEMDDFYARIIKSIANSPSADLAKCILKWTICSPKPLHLNELIEAVKLDIHRTLTTSASQLETLTGHLLFVDQQSRVHVTHQTTSAFLTQQKEGFRIDRSASNSRIAEICLEILCSADFSPPRVRRGNAASKGNTSRSSIQKATSSSPLANYAALNFSYHLIHGSSATDANFILLNKFLTTNVLTWIEKAAEMGSLAVLHLAAERLKTYLGRRAKYQSPVNVETQTVTTWSADLYHLVAAFHSNLLDSPSSIHHLIPYLCPARSMIRQLFARSSKKLRVTGSMEEEWTDRLTSYLFPDEASAVAYSNRLVAVGLNNGEIRMYHATGSKTFANAGTLRHGKKVRQIVFSQSSSLLASCSARKLMLWDVHASQSPAFPCLWKRDLNFTPSHVVFNHEEKLLTLTNPALSAIASYQLEDGTAEGLVLLHGLVDSDSDSDSSSSVVSGWTPAERIKLDLTCKLGALSYRNASVVIWDLASNERIGRFEKEGFENVHATPQTLDMLFNPIAELELLATVYKDGDIVTCNPWTLEQVNCYHLDVLVVALSATSDGRVLGSATEDGAIHLFLFETLQPLYKIERPDDHVRIYDITFSSDNLRICDIRGQSCNIWEPYVLNVKDSSDDSSSEPHSEEIVLQTTSKGQAHIFEWGEAITVIETALDDNVLFVGRQDGTIDLCELATGDSIEKFRFHDSFTEIRYISWNSEKNILLSVDGIGRCILTQLPSLRTGASTKRSTLVDYRAEGFVVQAILGPRAESLLIRTQSAVKLISSEGNVIKEESEWVGGWWMKHPDKDSILLVSQAGSVSFFDWESLSEMPNDGLSALPTLTTVTENANHWVGGPGSNYAVQVFIQPQTQQTTLIAMDVTKVTEGDKDMHLQSLSIDSLQLQYVVGCWKSNLYFLDTTGWVCSISLKTLSEATHYTRHFFIPLTWRTGHGSVVKIISKTAVAFGRAEQLVVFHGFLEFEEKVAI
ncbi:hypothetical protein S7711_02741 [Stachybotrys chartarum IBT 7711]|uniref:NACHT domain-containing protein n=1 Tax=Stachybotrys chartarum (strain CBS 109288 / IBT 7711) TaxID=1280523 RepID=A0A084ALU7_STACB|nr:hypothetical protein S7711_02741 [Stachybotrys chartarum IBT 7711]